MLGWLGSCNRSKQTPNTYSRDTQKLQHLLCLPVQGALLCTCVHKLYVDASLKFETDVASQKLHTYIIVLYRTIIKTGDTTVCARDSLDDDSLDP